MKKRKMKRKYNVWSKQDVKKLMSMVAKSHSNEEIAEALGRKRTDIACKKSNLGIAGGPTKRARVDRSVVTNHSRRWSAEEHNDLLVMLDLGASTDKCAKSLGRTVSSIENRVALIRRYGDRNTSTVTERTYLWGLLRTKLVT